MDDLALVRLGLKHVIGSDAGLVVCGEAATARECLPLIGRLRPDLVILDLYLPDKDGLELLKELRELWPRIPILVFSVADENLYAGRVLQAGARGYLMKKGVCEGLLKAIYNVLHGKIHVSETVSSTIVESYSGNRSSASPFDNLTDRELEVTRLIGAGWSTKDIAQFLHVSGKTVEAHRSNIRRKLGAKSPADLMRMAIHLCGNDLRDMEIPAPASKETG